MSNPPYTQLIKGSFLVASPEIEDPLYFHSIVLLCEHSASGSFGLIINKPLEIQLPTELLELKQIINPHLAIRAGGPIQPNQMLLLHSSDQLSEQALKICDGVYLGGDLHFLQQAMSDVSGPHVRLCFGYTAWHAGQLEKEFLNGNWFLCPASAKHVFESPSDQVWRTILREMGGKYATLSMIPDDLSLN